MNKSILTLAALIVAAPAFAGEPRIHSTRDSGSYEATLRMTGVPIDGGLAWSGHGTAPAVSAAVARKAPAVAHAAIRGGKAG